MALFRQVAIEVGTAFLVCGPYDDVGNQDKAQQQIIRANTLDDLITATSNTFLGLTVNCARCHHHKFDPIPTKDYYSLYGIFASSDEPTNPPLFETPPQTEEYQKFEKELTLREGKLREAEAFLQNSLKLQDERVEAQALYNLGHVRYAQGAEELKRAPTDAAVAQRAQNALRHGDQALHQATDALAGSDVQTMVAAYLNGRGARKDLRETIDLVRRALAAHGATLLKWQRALGDFKSALELHPNDKDTKRNIEIVEEAIAKLIEKMQQMAQLAQLMGQQREAIGEAMKQLRGKMPAPDAPPGEAGDEGDEDDVERPKGPREGQEEGRSREGKEQRRLTPQEAGWLLESFKLGGDRRLPMGQGEEGKPKDLKGNNW